MNNNLDGILSAIDSLGEQEKRVVLSKLRSSLPPHQMEVRLNASIETVLEAIARASALTIRGIEGIIAEAAFAIEVLPDLSGWKQLPTPPNAAFDFLMANDRRERTVRVQVKMQRRKAHKPLMANEVWKRTRRWPADGYIVEVQRTRAGEDAEGQGTRPYRFGEFDVLAVSLGASKGRWRDFTYTVADWLLEDPQNPKQILKYQPVAPNDNDDWTSDFDTVGAWFDEGRQKRIAG